MFSRCRGAAQTCCSSLHSDNGERSAEGAGLAQRGFIPSDTELHQTKISLRGLGEVEALGPQSFEKGNRDWHVGAACQLQRHHRRNRKIQGKMPSLQLHQKRFDNVTA